MADKIKAELLVFDLDGTLVDSLGDIADSLNYTARQMGFPAVDEAQFPAAIGNGVRVLIQKLLQIEPESEQMKTTLEHFVGYYSNNLTKRTQILNNVEKILQHFEGKKMAVLSNKLDSLTKGIIHELGFDRYFFMAVGQNEQFERKPHPAVLHYIIEKAGCQANQTVMIGDGDADIMVGKNAGTYTCAYTQGFRSEEQLKALNPDFVITDMIQLLDIIE